MNLSTPLFQGPSIRLTPIDHDQDADVEARWTQDPQYLRWLDPRPARPKSPSQIRKHYEALEKAAEEEKNQFYFAIRTHSTLDHPAEGESEPGTAGRLIGFVQLYHVEWNNGIGMVKIGIGDRQDRHQGYGREALSLVVHYAFAELNLLRLSASVPEYNLAALRLFTGAGFVEEVRRREALERDGRRWDMLHLGLLHEDWEGKA